MMAAAESRTVWQRTVNRCFVQEDAKRAPKLTCCQSSSSSSAKQFEDSVSSRASSVDPLNQTSRAGFIPLHPNQNLSDLLPHNTRLWSHHQHIHVNKPLEAAFNNQVGISEKNQEAGPWWRTTDKDELASMVTQRSLDYVENCDLPTPQKMKRSYYGSPRCFQDYSDSNQTIQDHGPSRGSSFKNRTEALSEPDISKSELLEALRHSQTRAREAENTAKEAYEEKEQLVKILFKQASELFGYKQWLQVLHLEAVYLQIKNKIDNKNETPVWNNEKARKPGRKKRSKPNRAYKYVIGLVFGMSLVGAGLLLGWTVGWMQIFSF